MAMRTVALLTIFFLPATLFWRSPCSAGDAMAAADMLGPHFWVYWAATLPLTGAVLAAWNLWTSAVMKRQQRENAVAREKES
ncbi:hypothetical protein B0H67DRAFT_645085 [Lasiosphaeris hirsuta]|uniref:Uncharacterized protein n=1 Tax=Lasiosphaeris hirsuta TaxID=260670 RepID=A0AA40AG91_9PEZI|nr:hypothetical protein B0H67DRAFT_645085 [Lasiosphaeris hirsuta]